MGVPGEPTTMAGRRIRDVVSSAADVDPERILVSGLTNEYTHYVATYEEYQVLILSLRRNKVIGKKRSKSQVLYAMNDEKIYLAILKMW